MDPGGPTMNAPQHGGISRNSNEPQVSHRLNLHARLQIPGDPPLKWGIPECAGQILPTPSYKKKIYGRRPL